MVADNPHIIHGIKIEIFASFTLH